MDIEYEMRNKEKSIREALHKEENDQVNRYETLEIIGFLLLQWLNHHHYGNSRDIRDIKNLIY